MKIEHARTLTRTRTRLGMTKKTFASLLGVSRHTIDRVEAFSTNSPEVRYPYVPSVATAIKFSSFLKVEVQDLVTKKDLHVKRRTNVALPQGYIRDILPGCDFASY